MLLSQKQHVGMSENILRNILITSFLLVAFHFSVTTILHYSPQCVSFSFPHSLFPPPCVRSSVQARSVCYKKSACCIWYTVCGRQLWYRGESTYEILWKCYNHVQTVIVGNKAVIFIWLAVKPNEYNDRKQFKWLGLPARLHRLRVEWRRTRWFRQCNRAC